MASIQVLELRPVEGQIEDLSYDMTDIIRGGTVQGAYKCLFDGITLLLAELQGDGLTPTETVLIWADTLTCVVEQLFGEGAA